MEGQHAVAVVFALVIICVNGEFAFDRCLEQGGLQICPNPVILRKSKAVRIFIQCNLVKGLLQSLQIGIAKVNEDSIRFFYTVKKEKDKPTEYVRGSRSFTPESPTSWSETPNSLTLLLLNATISDVRSNWFCQQQFKRYKGQENVEWEHPFTYIRAIPYPINTTLTVTPTGQTHPGDSIINLHCRGYSSFNFSVTSGRQLQTRFEYFDEEQWKLLQYEDGRQVVGIVPGDPEVDGDYLIRTYTLKLRVSSIPECSRQFRCMQFYESRIFVTEAAYIVIHVQACTGNCILDYDCANRNVTSSGFQAIKGILFQVSLVTGSAFLLLLIAILFFIYRNRKNSKKNKKLHKERRASQVSRQSITLRPTSMIPNDDVSVSETSSYRSPAAASVCSRDSPTHSVTSDLESMASTNIETNPGVLVNPRTSIPTDSRHVIRH